MGSKRAQRPGEFALIAKYFQPLARETGTFSLLDDAALYRASPGAEIVLTLDTVAAGIHFAADDPPDQIARKALRVNLSDLAAKGAKPVAYLLSLALADDWTEAWVASFARGLAADQRTYGIGLVGGDTTRASGGLTITVTAIGEVPKGKMVLRSGAKPGDTIFVSGTIGDAALGLAVRCGDIDVGDQKAAACLEKRYLLPQPRVALAPVLSRFANSALDVSDGLVGDLAHICGVSGVGAQIFASKVPLSPAARALATNEGALKTVLSGGDDYEILATVAEAKAETYIRESKAAAVRVSRIGTIVEPGNGVVVVGRDGTPMAFDRLAHTHF